MIEERHGSTITFRTQPKNGLRIKVLFAFEGLVALCCGFGIAPTAMDALKSFSGIGFVLIWPVDLLCLFAGIRFIVKIFDREKIIVSPGKFKIEVRKWLKTRTKEYPLDDIAGISYAGYSTKTDHPLKGQSYDYLGFETREIEITKLHDDGNLRLSQGNKTIVFGQNINTWDAQQISNVLSSLTDGRLYIQNLPEEIPEEVYMVSINSTEV